jgi:hypothetical protein
MVTFQSPDDAEEAAAALAEVGYTFEQTPYVFDEDGGILLTPAVYGVITGYTSAADERALFAQLIEITGPFGTCDCCGFRDVPTSQAERYKRWTGKSVEPPKTAGVATSTTPSSTTPSSATSS